MASRGRSNLNVNGRGADTNWFQNGQNIYQYMLWVKAINHIPENFDITANNSTYAYGCKSQFTFNTDSSSKTHL